MKLHEIHKLSAQEKNVISMHDYELLEDEDKLELIEVKNSHVMWMEGIRANFLPVRKWMTKYDMDFYNKYRLLLEETTDESDES